ncbi:MAG: hypothetical protein K5639_00785 [Eubacterium sp.]|nr:hypothetical protein [Eubacterium sp.]
MRKCRKRVAKMLVFCLTLSLIRVVGITSEETPARAKMIWDEHITQETFAGREETINIVAIGDKTLVIDDDAFINLPNLKSISLVNSPNYAVFFYCLYTKDYRELIYVPPCVGDDIAFHSKLTVIRPYALYRAPQALAEKARQVADKNWYRENPTPTPTVTATPVPTVKPYPTPALSKENTLYDQMTKKQKKELKKRLKLTKKTKPYIKYCGFDKYKNIYFHYFGQDKVVHIPDGIQLIYGFSPDFFTHNTTVEKIVMPDRAVVCYTWTCFIRSIYGMDQNFYYPFYFCDNLKKICLVKTKKSIFDTEWKVKKKGKVLYYEKKKVWQYGKRIPDK